MQAIILAAGMGKRLKGLTADNTKCMVKVNGVTLIERMLNQLDALNLSKIIIVIGYEGEKLAKYVESLGIKTEICYVENPIYNKTNNIYSLALAKHYLVEEDTLLLESDLIFEDSLLTELLSDDRETLALVDKYESWMDGTVVKLSQDDSIQAFVPGKKFEFEDIPHYYKTVNIYKFSKNFSANYYVPFLDAYSKALGNNEYYEQVLRVITLLDEPAIKGKRLNGQLWYEIDDIQDLDIASSMFAPDEDDKLELIQGRYGGYWRYPKLIDFCYLVNPYYPPEKLKDELKANFDRLLTEYPSGMGVNSLLAAKNFGVSSEHIVVGNGAAELIKAIMENSAGNIGVVRPTFEEYPNRYSNERLVNYYPDSEDFAYNGAQLSAYFDKKDISTLIIVNPDNPTGNYLTKAELLELIKWGKEKGIRLIIDESFVDFADELDASLICEEIISEYKELIIIKSISKSYGVPGLRLGIAVSSNTGLIGQLKKQVAIWNINSFGEFYMQIAEKYKSDYIYSLELIKKTRASFVEALKKIEGLRIIPSQANYIMCEVTGKISARELTKHLLIKYNLFIKDLSGKVSEGKQYIRVAVRREEDNAKLVQALNELL